MFRKRETSPEETPGPGRKESSRLEKARRRMIEVDLAGRGIEDRRVLAAMGTVPRHRFVKQQLAAMAYEDHPLDIPQGQTISQPYIVAKMTELLNLEPGDKILEIGAGSGYQTAVLLEMGATVYCVEIIEELATALEERLRNLDYASFEVSCHDGSLGWAEHALYDGILLAAAPKRLPRLLLEQAREGATIVAPIEGEKGQTLKRWIRSGDRWTSEDIIPVRFVPMVGGASAC